MKDTTKLVKEMIIGPTIPTSAVIAAWGKPSGSGLIGFTSISFEPFISPRAVSYIGAMATLTSWSDRP
jgi:hypothetical protein